MTGQTLCLSCVMMVGQREKRKKKDHKLAKSDFIGNQYISDREREISFLSDTKES